MRLGASQARRRRRRSRGFSLVELIVFIVVVGVGLAGVLAVLNLGAQKSADPMVRKQALAIAEQMLEEVALQPFGPNPGSCTYATRASCDDLQDYDGFSATTILDLGGSPVSGLSGYSLAVAVTSTGDLAPVPAADARRITVTVTGKGESITLIGYRTRYD
ncbi:MAG: prepilin-type N-terminal cleavage/methylation domain-containing protein [Burkholderiales bacterium]|nr:prepilin-type N-terminal cleavage/methylation domain-containing protein [Burkholderiales bacterium]MDW8469717.1 prepilin-type N-terminal cleavage/methylation domain-containing protein [Burkholderiales bacterium]